MKNRIKLSNIALLAMVGLLLTACRDDAALIKQIQRNFDNNNPTGNRAFCVLVGYNNNQYPYITQTILLSDIDKNIYPQEFKYLSNNTLNSRLALFSRLGLFNQELLTPAEQAEKGEAIYRYSLTDEGLKYSRLTADSTTFCFGRRVIEKIVSDRQDKDNWGNKVTTIRFNYQVEGMPDWAKDPEIVYEFGFSSFGLHVDGKPSTGSLFFRDSGDGLKISGGPSGMWLFR